MPATLLERCAILLSAIVLSLFTVAFQVRALGFDYLESEQLRRHRAVLHGTAGDPWQYRVLSESVAEGAIIGLKRIGLAHPIAAGFIAVRVVQNALLFFLAASYYRKLGLDTYTTLLGLSILAWGMSYSVHNSDLQFSTFSDIIFYLAAALSILWKRYLYIVPLAALAAVNRETSGLIPFMLLMSGLYASGEQNGSARLLALSVGAFALYLTAFVGLRYLYPGQAYVMPAPGLVEAPGLKLFWYNVGRSVTWVQLVATVGIIPWMAVWSRRYWPATLQVFFWTIVPIWLAVHAFTSVLAEARVLLVPHTLVFVPGALFGIAAARSPNRFLGAPDRGTASTIRGEPAR
jgi:hypothetical protein